MSSASTPTSSPSISGAKPKPRPTASPQAQDTQAQATVRWTFREELISHDPDYGDQSKKGSGTIEATREGDSLQWTHKSNIYIAEEQLFFSIKGGDRYQHRLVTYDSNRNRGGCTADRPNKVLDFPMRVGGSWSDSLRCTEYPARSMTISSKVDRSEKVKIGQTEYQAFVIVREIEETNKFPDGRTGQSNTTRTEWVSADGDLLKWEEVRPLSSERSLTYIGVRTS